jgi:DNA-binding MarR family transcriptional regulator
MSPTDAVLQRYHHLMRALRTERARRGSDPWSECPMTMAQMRALSLIAASQRGLSSRELAAMLGVGASAITPLVDRLVERAFARRTEDPHDRRIARLEATELGSALLERMVTGQGDVMSDILAQLEPSELEIVGAAFDVLQAGLQRTQTNSPNAPNSTSDTMLTPQGITA